MPTIHVLYTGGTIGCVENAEGALVPMPGGEFEALMLSMPGLAGGKVEGHDDLSWTFSALAPTLDSAAMTPLNWYGIAQAILSLYGEADGFVVLHGTDSMAYSASALSFLLPGLSKPVLLTGSQLPLSFTFNDALPNLVGAIVAAGELKVPEVCVYFDSLLLRGNRARKVDANQFSAFESPNCAPLARVGGLIVPNEALWLPPPAEEDSLDRVENRDRLLDDLNAQIERLDRYSVLVQWLYPGIRASALTNVLTDAALAVKGLVVLAYGAGNGPTDEEFLKALRDADEAGVVIMDNTQTQRGTVLSGAYGTGLGSVGAVGARDLTPEASYAKLVCLLAREGLDAATIKEMMREPLAGELTVMAES